MLEHLVRELNSRDEEIREVAFEKARSLPPGQLLRLVKLMADTNQTRGEDFAPVWFLSRLPNMLFRLAKLAYASIRGHEELARAFKPPGPPAQHALAKIVMQAEDPRYIAVALSLLQSARQDGVVLLRVSVALKRLLPQMREEDAGALTNNQAKTLLSLLNWPYFDIELSLCILKAVEQFGDEGAMPVIIALAEYGCLLDVEFVQENRSVYRRPDLTGLTPEKLSQVKQAARECLNQLSLRAEEAKQAQTLLRPSDASTITTPEVLLRPAAPTTEESKSEELLRPSSGEGAQAG